MLAYPFINFEASSGEGRALLQSAPVSVEHAGGIITVHSRQKLAVWPSPAFLTDQVRGPKASGMTWG